MNIEKLRKQLEIDEGVKYEIYNDHLGYATFGVGHLVLETDPEYGRPVGTTVSESRVVEVFKLDCESVLIDCITFIPRFLRFTRRSSTDNCEHDVQYG